MKNQVKKNSISLIVALYNEEAVVSRTVDRLIEYMDENYADRDWEIVLVDDGSADNTVEVVKGIAEAHKNISLIRHRRNHGQGRAFRNAFATARGDIFVTLDADLSYEPKYIGRLIDEIETAEADIVIASAFLPGSKIVNIPLHRKILTICANKFLSWTSSLDVSAITCAVRAYRRNIVQMLPLNSDGMEINLEIILKAQMLGLHVTEIPATLKWEKSKTSQPKRRSRSYRNLMQTISRYFFFGYLFNPNILFLIPMLVSLAVFIVYAVSLSVIMLDKLQTFMGMDAQPFLIAASNAIRAAFADHTHAFYFLISSLGVSFFLFIAWFVTKQNKFYYEQNYSLSALLLSAQKKLKDDQLGRVIDAE